MEILESTGEEGKEWGFCVDKKSGCRSTDVGLAAAVN